MSPPIFVVGLAVSLLACAPTHSTLPLSTCPAIAVSAEGWLRVDLGPSKPATRYVVAGSWRKVERGDQPVHLTVWSTTGDSTDIELLRGVLQSVQFEQSE
jgi:hypothetical protein